MNSIENKAYEVASSIESKGIPKATAFDPATIILIIKLISMSIELFKSCQKNPKEAIDRINSPGILDDMRLRALTIKAIGLGHPLQRSELREALREIAKKTSVIEMTQMYKEIPVGG